MRTRSMLSSLSTPPVTAIWWAGSGQQSGRTSAEAIAYATALPKIQSSELPGQKLLKVTVDKITPGFTDIVKKNEFRPINPMSSYITANPGPAITRCIFGGSAYAPPTFNNIPANPWWNVSFGSFKFERSFSHLGRPLHDESDIQALANSAKAKCIGAGMDYATTLAESRATLAMLTGLKGRLQDRIDACSKAWEKDLTAKRRKGKFRGFNSMLEAWNSFSNFWLEYRFGWRILYYDLKSIYDYFERRNDGVVLFTRRETSEKEDKTRHYDGMIQIGQSSFIELWREETYTETLRVGYSASVDQSSLGNPIALNTLYDVTPWTLVLDMFFNIQDNIIAHSVLPIGVESVADSGFFSSKKTSSVAWSLNAVSCSVFNRNEVVHGPIVCPEYTRDKFGNPNWNVSFQPSLTPGKIIDLATLTLPALRVIRKFFK